ncbi:uncharacterized protein LOC143291623 isoform X2 [Babylonia areolata]|uniref:uncharacterized protein LOC143291623 isoform X2 n=1 Tax=Babylonia areolata TaxID=304850 RepID=UPI003FD507D8
MASNWYTELDFDHWVLDILLLFWCGTAAGVVMTVNSIKNALGPVVRQPAAERMLREPTSGATDGGLEAVAALAKRGESCQWFNTAISWLYLHYYNAPDYLNQWVDSLNLQLTKLGGPVTNKVEKVQPSSLPPRVLNIQTQSPPDGSVVLLTKVESQDLLLSIFASQQTSEGVRLTNCVAHVLKLNGVLRLKFYREKKDVKVRVNFDSHPEVKVEVTPSNPYQEPSTLADLGVVERNVRHALALAVTTFTITKLLMPGDLSTIPHPHADVDDEEVGGGPPTRPGEIRVRASDAGWGMSASDIAMLNQRVQNKMAQVAAFNQKMQQQQPPPTIHEVPPQTRPTQAEAKVSVQPQPSEEEGGKKAPLAGSGGL